ncbi:MAG: Rieske (2Fe-2S) protein [Acidobacteria bacterium]|nr:Rieske (2Fe-2S) protein [Acidobacteriota bacterium]
MASALLVATLGALRLPRAAVLPSPSKTFRVTIPETLPAGEPFVPPGRSVALFRDGEGIHAISIVCTHLGCIIKATAGGFECPCHGSKFASDGAVTGGPAPAPLPWRQVTVNGNAVIVDEETSVPAGTKVQA